MSLFARLREACAEVSRRARFVRIDREALERRAAAFAAERPELPALIPPHEALGSAHATMAYVVTMDAINFGSGWFPVLRKRLGCSGYLTIATALRERFLARGPWSAAELAELRAEDCAEVFGQTASGEAGELMELFATALRDLGVFLETRCAGRFEGLVESADGSAERMVTLLAEMPLFRDVSRYEELELPFYKRAQITCSDLAEAFGESGPGAFRDLGELTLFADNLVPHVLRMDGVLVYAPDLERRIEGEELIPHGSPEEVEIRAVALHAVEALVAACRERGWPTTAHRLDHLLWTRGQSPEIKAVPRHRTRCTFY